MCVCVCACAYVSVCVYVCLCVRLEVQALKDSVSKDLDDLKTENQFFMTEMTNVVQDGKRKHQDLSNEVSTVQAMHFHCPTIYSHTLRLTQTVSHTHTCSYRGFPTRMVYLYYISYLRYTILVGNPQYASCHKQIHIYEHTFSLT